MNKKGWKPQPFVFASAFYPNVTRLSASGKRFYKPLQLA